MLNFEQSPMLATMRGRAARPNPSLTNCAMTDSFSELSEFLTKTHDRLEWRHWKLILLASCGGGLDYFDFVVYDFPRMLFGYISDAVETGAAFEAARSAYADYSFVPRTLVDASWRSQARDLFGRTYAAPFGIAPMGGAALAAYDGDNALARAAAAQNIPACLSAASLTRLETVRSQGATLWFQVHQ